MCEEECKQVRKQFLLRKNQVELGMAKKKGWKQVADIQHSAFILVPKGMCTLNELQIKKCTMLPVSILFCYP